jgi:hypothetical protein
MKIVGAVSDPRLSFSVIFGSNLQNSEKEPRWPRRNRFVIFPLQRQDPVSLLY